MLTLVPRSQINFSHPSFEPSPQPDDPHCKVVDVDTDEDVTTLGFVSFASTLYSIKFRRWPSFKMWTSNSGHFRYKTYR